VVAKALSHVCHIQHDVLQGNFVPVAKAVHILLEQVPAGMPGKGQHGGKDCCIIQ
jgi:hypothetical protein